MLILTRRIGEALMIADELKVSIVGIEGEKVKIKIDEIKEEKVSSTFRFIGEPLVLLDNVEIHFLKVTGCQLRIGIDAPRYVSVHREEIYKKIQAEKSEPITLSKRGLAMLG